MDSSMKTPVTVLQEMMVKQNRTPDYECIAQSGPQHLAMFEYRCTVLGTAVTAQARTKKEAKQEVARRMLRLLASKGHPVPAPYSLHHMQCGAPSTSGAMGEVSRPSSQPRAPSEPGSAGAGGATASRSYVALLQELCTEYRLPAPEYELVGDTGPPHLRHFTVAVRAGNLQRLATATTKKAARQQAAEQLYGYLRENLARLTTDFVEEDALVRAHEKAMNRYMETRDEGRRPDLGQKIADYHLGLVAHIDADRCEEALRVLREEDNTDEELAKAFEILGLRVEAELLPLGGGGQLHVLVVDASPSLAFAGRRPEQARAFAADYLKRALRQPRP